ASHLRNILLLLHHGDDGLRGLRAHFRAMCLILPQYIAGKFDTGHLHAQANTEEWNPLLAGYAYCFDFSFYAAASKAGGHQDGVQVLQLVQGILSSEMLGVDIAYLYLAFIHGPGMYQRFEDALVGILQLYIFTDEAHRYFGFRVTKLIQE